MEEKSNYITVTNKTNLNREVFICDCESLEHQYTFWYDEDDNTLWFEPHLNSRYNWFERLLVGIKYIFGYKTRYGNWDSVIFKSDDLPKLKEYIDNAIKVNEKHEKYHENQKKEFNI